MVTPELTMPTILPRSPGAARSPTNGRMICPETVAAPRHISDAPRTAKDGATAHAANAITDTPITMPINARRGTTSPNGTMSSTPTA